MTSLRPGRKERWLGILNLDLPPPIPHPDHVKIDFRKGTVHFAGPITKEEKAEVEMYVSHKQDFIDELDYLERQLADPAFEGKHNEIRKEIGKTKEGAGDIGEAECLIQIGSANCRRPHSSLDLKTPDQVYFNAPMPIPAAASSRPKST